MDDLNQQLQKILSDPQAMGQIQSLLGSLGNSQEEAPPRRPKLPPGQTFPLCWELWEGEHLPPLKTKPPWRGSHLRLSPP